MDKADFRSYCRLILSARPVCNMVFISGIWRLIMTLTMYQFQGFMAVIFGLTCLLMCYHVGKLEERIAKLEYELNKEYLDRVKTITKTIIR